MIKKLKENSGDSTENSKKKMALKRMANHVAGLWINKSAGFLDYRPVNKRLLNDHELYAFSRDCASRTGQYMIMSIATYYRCTGAKYRYQYQYQEDVLQRYEIKKCMLERKHESLDYLLNSIKHQIMYIASRELTINNNKDVPKRSYNIAERHMKNIFNASAYTSMGTAMLKTRFCDEFKEVLIQQIEMRLQLIEETSHLLPNSYFLNFLVNRYKAILKETIIVINLQPKKYFASL